MADARFRAVGESEVREPTVPAAQPEEPSIAQLINNLIVDGQTLIRREFDLAKAEILGEVNKARQSVILLGAGAALAAIGGLFLLAMVAELLVAVGLDRWLSYLIVGGVLAIVGGIILYSGIRQVQRVDPVPHETIDSVRKDVEWLKEQSPSDRT
ncbi:MAG: phage holin family protein [Oscillochloris sp.]|nr:phage holin family protein [Oscillochloris sp.]